MDNKELYEHYRQEHIDDNGKENFHDAYALQYLVEHCIKNKNYTHISEVKYNDQNKPLVGDYEIICCTYNDPIFGIIRVQEDEDVLVFSTSDGLKCLNL